MIAGEAFACACHCTVGAECQFAFTYKNGIVYCVILNYVQCVFNLCSCLFSLKLTLKIFT